MLWLDWPSNSEQFPFLKRWNPFSGSKVMSLLAPGTLPNLTALPQLVLHRRGLDTVMIRLDTVRVRMYAMKNYSLFPLDLHCTVYWLYTVQSLWCTRYPLLMQLCVVQRISWKMCLGCGNMCVTVLKAPANVGEAFLTCLEVCLWKISYFQST